MFYIERETEKTTLKGAYTTVHNIFLYVFCFKAVAHLVDTA